MSNGEARNSCREFYRYSVRVRIGLFLPQECGDPSVVLTQRAGGPHQDTGYEAANPANKPIGVVTLYADIVGRDLLGGTIAYGCLNSRKRWLAAGCCKFVRAEFRRVESAKGSPQHNSASG